MPNMSSETPATTRELARALRGGDALGDERRKQVVHRARRALELDLPQELHAPDVGLGEDLLVAHPAGAGIVDALGEEVGGAADDARQQQDEHADPGHSHVYSPLRV